MIIWIVSGAVGGVCGEPTGDGGASVGRGAPVAGILEGVLQRLILTCRSPVKDWWKLGGGDGEGGWFVSCWGGLSERGSVVGVFENP